MGGFDIVHLKDSAGGKFTTRAAGVFVVGKNQASCLVSLPRSKGIKLSIIQERNRRLKRTRESVKSSSAAPVVH